MTQPTLHFCRGLAAYHGSHSELGIIRKHGRDEVLTGGRKLVYILGENETIKTKMVSELCPRHERDRRKIHVYIKKCLSSRNFPSL